MLPQAPGRRDLSNGPGSKMAYNMQAKPMARAEKDPRPRDRLWPMRRS